MFGRGTGDEAIINYFYYPAQPVCTGIIIQIEISPAAGHLKDGEPLQGICSKDTPGACPVKGTGVWSFGIVVIAC